jgi:hypothetical protein
MVVPCIQIAGHRNKEGKFMKRFIASMRMAAMSVAVLLPVSHAFAAGSSSAYGMGGQFSEFDPIVSQYNRSGEPFRIEGHCQSACTLFLAIRNVCIDPGATLLFHAGHDRGKNVTAGATHHLLSAYNGRLRSYVMANHYMDTLEFHSISGDEMIQKFGYRACRA